MPVSILSMEGSHNVASQRYLYKYMSPAQYLDPSVLVGRSWHARLAFMPAPEHVKYGGAMAVMFCAHNCCNKVC